MEIKQHAATKPVSQQEKKEKNLENNANENISIQNQWDTTKAILRGKPIVIQTFLKKKNLKQSNLSPKRTNKT